MYQNNKNPTSNNYPKMNPQATNQNRANGNQRNVPHKKYEDLEIQTFFNDLNSTGLSAKDMDLKGELDIITNQYMSTFNNINELARKFSQGNDNMYRVSMIQKDIEQLEFENGNEYANFIGQLFEVTKNANVTNLGYDSYKKNPRDGEQKVKKYIGDYKYDIILFTNKNSSQTNYNRLQNYVNEQKRKQNYYGSNNNYNQNLSPAPNQNNYNYQNYNNNPNGNNYYNNYNNGGNYGNNYNNQYNQNYGNNNYNYNYNNNYSGGKIKVKFVVNGRSIYQDFNPNDSGEELYLFAMRENDYPKICSKNGQLLSRESLRAMRIADVFAENEPILDIC